MSRSEFHKRALASQAARAHASEPRWPEHYSAVSVRAMYTSSGSQIHELLDERVEPHARVAAKVYSDIDRARAEYDRLCALGRLEPGTIVRLSDPELFVDHSATPPCAAIFMEFVAGRTLAHYQRLRLDVQQTAVLLDGVGDARFARFFERALDPSPLSRPSAAEAREWLSDVTRRVTSPNPVIHGDEQALEIRVARKLVSFRRRTTRGGAFLVEWLAELGEIDAGTEDERRRARLFIPIITTLMLLANGSLFALMLLPTDVMRTPGAMLLCVGNVLTTTGALALARRGYLNMAGFVAGVLMLPFFVVANTMGADYVMGTGFFFCLSLPIASYAVTPRLLVLVFACAQLALVVSWMTAYVTLIPSDINNVWLLSQSMLLSSTFVMSLVYASVTSRDASRVRE